MKISRLVVFVFCIVCVTYSLGQEVGNATFYSSRMNGRRMSNGEKYHRDSMVCAHKTYPLNSYLKVVNPKNKKTVIVKVADRGPFSKRLIIDLSYSAAKQLGIIKKGIARVKIFPYHSTSFNSNIVLKPILLLPEDIISTTHKHYDPEKYLKGVHIH